MEGVLPQSEDFDYDPVYGQPYAPPPARGYGGYPEASPGNVDSFFNRPGGNRRAPPALATQLDPSDMASVESPAPSYTSATSQGSTASWNRPLSTCSLNADAPDGAGGRDLDGGDMRRAGRRWDGVILEGERALFNMSSGAFGLGKLTSPRSTESEFGCSTSVESIGADNAEPPRLF